MTVRGYNSDISVTIAKYIIKLYNVFEEKYKKRGVINE